MTAGAILMALGLGACGGDDEGGGESAPQGAAGGQQQREQQPEAEAPEDPAVVAAEEFETEARGTMDAFLAAVDDEDEEVFCGIVSQAFLDKIFPDNELDRASCQTGLEDGFPEGLSEIEGTTVTGVTTPVLEKDGEFEPASALVDIEQGSDKAIITMTREDDRYVLDEFQAVE